MWTCTHCSHANLAAATSCAHCATPRASSDRSITGDRTFASFAAPTSEHLHSGLRVGGDGRYELIAKLGEGGMGSVWRAKDLKLTREVAIKRIRGATSPALQERFLRETRALTGLSHPNVVTVFDAGEDAYGNYLVMELVSGKTLAQRLKEGPIEASQAVDLFCAMCKGMSHAHKRGVIHRDLKPSNVMLNDDGVARILDFGLARLQGSGDLSLTGVGVGTLDYASPEQRHEAGAASERSEYRCTSTRCRSRGVACSSERLSPVPMTDLEASKKCSPRWTWADPDGLPAGPIRAPREAQMT
jgi:serine/threonine protein kinase